MTKKLEQVVKVARRMPTREGRIELDGMWEGWWFVSDLAPTFETLEGLVSPDFRQIAASMALCISSWNFVDRDGKEMKSPQDHVDENPDLNGDELFALKYGACKVMPYDLGMAVAKGIIIEVNKIPKN